MEGTLLHNPTGLKLEQISLTTMVSRKGRSLEADPGEGGPCSLVLLPFQPCRFPYHQQERRARGARTSLRPSSTQRKRPAGQKESTLTACPPTRIPHVPQRIFTPVPPHFYFLRFPKEKVVPTFCLLNTFHSFWLLCVVLLSGRGSC